MGADPEGKVAGEKYSVRSVLPSLDAALDILAGLMRRRFFQLGGMRKTKVANPDPPLHSSSRYGQDRPKRGDTALQMLSHPSDVSVRTMTT